jgi:[ribosomal protein S5]-alanine N-acetyltransferase
VPVRLVAASVRYQTEFLAAVRRSKSLHRPWVAPPDTAARFRDYLSRRDGERGLGFFVLDGADALVGVINVNEIVRGVFQSGYLGYYAFAPYAGKGLMTEGLSKAVSTAFRTHRLHRLEASIQPTNHASVALVKRLGFRLEGFSPRYLKIGGVWRDHERWAITRDEW